MKSHIFISVGLLVAAIFVWRALEAWQEPGIGMREMYVLGGFVVAALLIRQGFRDRGESR